MEIYWSLPESKSGKVRVKFTRGLYKTDKGAVLYAANWLDTDYIPLLAQFVKDKTAEQLLNEGMAIADKPYDANGNNYWNVWRNNLLKKNGVSDADLPAPGAPTDDQIKVMEGILSEAKYYSWYEYAWNWVGFAGTALFGAFLIWVVKKFGKKGKSN